MGGSEAFESDGRPRFFFGAGPSSACFSVVNSAFESEGRPRFFGAVEVSASSAVALEGRPRFFFGAALSPGAAFPSSSESLTCALPALPRFPAAGASCIARSDSDCFPRFLGGCSSRCGGVAFGFAAHQSEGRDRFLLGASGSGAYVMLGMRCQVSATGIFKAHLPYLMLCCCQVVVEVVAYLAATSTDAFHARAT